MEPFPAVLASVLHDFRYACRSLRREAGFTVFAIAILGLGIGASATVFNVLNALLVRPLPFRDPQQLMWITNHDTSGLSGQTTQVDYLLDLRGQNRSFSDLAAYFAFYGVGDSLLTGQGEPERLNGVPVSDNFFQVLGVQPLLGRLFTAEECQWHGPRGAFQPAAVLLGYGIWTRRFGSDPGIVGRALVINDEPVTVAGVLPAFLRFRLGLRARQPHRPVLPVSAQPGDQPLGQHHGHHRAAEAGRLHRPGPRRAEHPGAADAEGASRAQRIRRLHRSAGGTRERPPAPGAVRAGGRGRAGHADRLRQSFEPAAGADGGAAEGNRHSRGPGRRARPAGAPDAHRKPDAFRCGSGARRDPRRGRNPRALPRLDGQHPAAPQCAHRYRGAGLHPAGRRTHRPGLRPGARAADVPPPLCTRR